VASTTRDQSGNSGNTAEHHDGPCSSSRSLSKVMSCSSFFFCPRRRWLQYVGNDGHDSPPSYAYSSLFISPLSLYTHELIAQTRPHRSAVVLPLLLGLLCYELHELAHTLLVNLDELFFLWIVQSMKLQYTLKCALLLSPADEI
jgi:hypothetical protein